jgi:hypothetical protein
VEWIEKIPVYKPWKAARAKENSLRKIEQIANVLYTPFDPFFASPLAIHGGNDLLMSFIDFQGPMFFVPEFTEHTK